jgi:cobalt/nickel transport system ATP-binding protein/precorrin-8X/cobalt-precorrin-8 methylmutase
LYARPLDGVAIETESFRRIDVEAPAHSFTPAQWQIARRLIHTTADFSLISELAFSPDALSRGCAALKAGAPIYVDSNMIAAGLSLARLQRCNSAYRREDIHVHVADPDVADAARASGLPRAVHALRKAAPVLEGAIVCFGNSPVGLLEVNRMIIEEGLMPALVVAMPVGFVHVTESKDELQRLSVPQIVVRGRRGGSPLAVATLHALAVLTAEESRS